jgi:SPP1 family predicted phage head-tail adaptor
MSATKYNQRVRVDKKTGTADPDYGTTGPASWVPVTTVWVEVQDVKPSRATEQVQNGLRLGVDKARVRMRYRSDITSDMRLVELSGRRRTLQIVSNIAVLGGGHEQECMVEGYTS